MNRYYVAAGLLSNCALNADDAVLNKAEDVEQLEAKLTRITEYFKKTGEITCVNCEQGPYTKFTELCADCEDFCNWEPEKH